ncbi:MAG TPA: transferrin receptor-like dimerization domain-containing protein, partial [Thermoanaerobaculia bacterium]
VNDPERNVSVLERLRDREQVLARTPELRKEARERALIRLDALGSGSDFTPFLQHTGVAAMNIGYGGEGGGGSYHSVYDSFDHYVRFGDPNFQYGIAQAETAGRLVLRLANADVLPLEFTTFADTLTRYLDELTKLAQTTRNDVEDRNRLVRERAFEIAADPTRTYVSPKMEPTPPFLNFAPLQNAIAKLQTSARNYDRAASSLPSDAPNASVREAALDQSLMHIEQALILPEGLPRRPWFRHQIYAPGFYTGYGVKTVPGVREAIEQKQWAEATQQIEIVSKVIENYAAQVDRAAEIARGRTE